MYGLTRAMTTLIGAATAGLLIWIATQIDDSSTGGYWAVYGILAGAGLVMALSQLFGGWTKWGWPRLSLSVFLLAFIPTLIVGGWILLAGQPDPNWFQRHVSSWSGDIHVRGLVNDLREYVGVIAFGIGLVFGFTFDTTGPRVAPPPGSRARRVDTVDRDVADEPLTRERVATDRAGEPVVTTDARTGTAVAPQLEPAAPGEVRRVD